MHDDTLGTDSLSIEDSLDIMDPPPFELNDPELVPDTTSVHPVADSIKVTLQVSDSTRVRPISDSTRVRNIPDSTKVQVPDTTKVQAPDSTKVQPVEL